ncbi:MAG: nitronate monooxygenase, partial [Marinobacter sp.]
TVWSAGQGVSQINDVVSVQALVSRLKQEYEGARARVCG